MCVCVHDTCMDALAIEVGECQQAHTHTHTHTHARAHGEMGRSDGAVRYSGFLETVDTVLLILCWCVPACAWM